jgi:hypothetical protein
MSETSPRPPCPDDRAELIDRLRDLVEARLDEADEERLL